jgi:hypothetical protein
VFQCDIEGIIIPSHEQEYSVIGPVLQGLQILFGIANATAIDFENDIALTQPGFGCRT